MEARCILQPDSRANTTCESVNTQGFAQDGHAVFMFPVGTTVRAAGTALLEFPVVDTRTGETAFHFRLEHGYASAGAPAAQTDHEEHVICATRVRTPTTQSVVANAQRNRRSAYDADILAHVGAVVHSTSTHEINSKTAVKITFLAAAGSEELKGVSVHLLKFPVFSGVGVSTGAANGGITIDPYASSVVREFADYETHLGKVGERILREYDPRGQRNNSLHMRRSRLAPVNYYA